MSVETRVKIDRVASGRRWSSILEKQCELTHDEEVGAVNASDSISIVFNAAKVSATGNTSPSSGSNLFSATAHVRDSIWALISPTTQGFDESVPVFPPAPVQLRRGERAECLSEFMRAVGVEVTLNRKHHTAAVYLFAGSKALRTRACEVLLAMGSPASFIQEQVWLRMLACGAASEDGLKSLGQKIWGGFHGTSLITSSQVRLNVQLGNVGRLGWSSTVCLVVHANIVPDSAISTVVLLGRNRWSHFPARKYRDVNEAETVVAFLANESAPPDDLRFRQWVKGAVGMTECKRQGRAVVRVASHRHRLPNVMSWLPVRLTNTDGTDAAEGAYFSIYDWDLIGFHRKPL